MDYDIHPRRWLNVWKRVQHMYRGGEVSYWLTPLVKRSIALSGFKFVRMSNGSQKHVTTKGNVMGIR